ncbi:MAG TPA: ABC transporter permease [Spirochaetia bacterium]|nr:ABC transporter permease [Spirochaetia bacterium]
MKRTVGQVLADLKLLLIILALVVVLSAADRSFLSWATIVSLFDHVAINGIMAAGMTILLISGSFDLSVGSVMAFTGIVIVLTQGFGTAASIALGLAAGTAAGALNGLLAVKGRINAFIVTLGSMIIFRGLGLAITNSHPVKGTIPAFAAFGQVALLGIPLPVFYLVAVYAAVWYVLRYTKFGRNDFAIGGNAVSARLAGIRVDLQTFLYFVACSFTAALAGLVLTSRVNTGSAVFGDQTPMLVIAAAVLGGTSLFGGKGTVIGTIQGVLILGLIERAMVIFNVDTNYQILLRGLIIIAVVVTDTLTARRREGAAAAG